MKTLILCALALLCAVASFAAPIAYYPLEIINIKPAGTGDPAIPSTNRIFRAYPGIEYNIGTAAIGGAFPYSYALSNAPAGMTVNATTGVIVWPNPTTDANNVVVSVTDSLNATVSATWSIDVTTEGFLFVQAGYSGTETGSITQPFSSFESFMSNIGTSHANDIVYFRAGTYQWYQTDATARQMILNGKAVKWLAYPGETVIMDAQDNFARVYTGDGPYWDGLVITNMTGYGVNGQGGFDYQTFRNCLWDGIVNPDMTNNNYGFVFFNEGCPGSFAVIQDNEWRNYDGTAAIGSMYGMHKVLIERNYIHSHLRTTQQYFTAPISAKQAVTRMTVRQNHIVRDRGTMVMSGGNYNSAMASSTGAEVCFNLFQYTSQQTVDFAHEINTRTGYGDYSDKCVDYVDLMHKGSQNIFYYRNTLIGSTLALQYVDGTYPELQGGCNFDIRNNVIVNDRTTSSLHTYRDGVFYHSTYAINNPWNVIDNTDNLYVTYSQNAVDEDGNLVGDYAQYADTVGWQAVAWGATPGDPIDPPPACDINNLNLCSQAECAAIGRYWYDGVCNAVAEQIDPEDPTPTPTTSGPILRTGSHLLRVGDSVLRVQ